MHRLAFPRMRAPSAMRMIRAVAEPVPAPAPSRPPGNYFDGLPVSEAQGVLFGLLMLVYFFQQYCNWNFSFLVPAFVRTAGLDTVEGYRVAARVGVYFFVGQTIGGVVTGILSDRFGRRPMLLVSLVIFSVFGLLSGLATSSEFFLICRAITGYGVFSVMVITNAYLAEITPAESRGKWQGITAGVGFMAIPLVGLLSWAAIPIAPEAWRYFFYFSGMGFMPFFLALLYLKESPRWLAAHGRVREAEDVMRRLSGRNVDLSTARETGGALPVGKAVRLLLGKKYRRRFLHQLLLYGIGMPAALMQLVWPCILLHAEIGLRPALGVAAVVTVSAFVGCFLCAYLTESAGRKKCLCGMYAAGGLGALGYAFCPAGSVAQVVLGIVYVLGSLGGTFGTFTYTAEVFPTPIRNTAVGFVQGFGRLCLVFFQFPALWLAEAYGRAGVYAFAGVLLLVAVPLVLFYTADTAGKPLESAAAPFNAGRWMF